jgi:hypothetical protein
MLLVVSSAATPPMNDVWGELSRLSFDERCRAV